MSVSLCVFRAPVYIEGDLAHKDSMENAATIKMEMYK
jgi:hypothetical protein